MNPVPCRFFVSSAEGTTISRISSLWMKSIPMLLMDSGNCKPCVRVLRWQCACVVGGGKMQYAIDTTNRLHVTMWVRHSWGVCMIACVSNKISFLWHLCCLHVRRIFGLGGEVDADKMLDSGANDEGVAGEAGLMWTTLHQIGQLVETARKVNPIACSQALSCSICE